MATFGAGLDHGELFAAQQRDGGIPEVFNLQYWRFSAVICRRCRYTEFYKTESGKLRNVIDIVAGT